MEKPLAIPWDLFEFVHPHFFQGADLTWCRTRRPSDGAIAASHSQGFKYASVWAPCGIELMWEIPPKIKDGVRQLDESP